jgi:hypothetical protein
LTRPDTIEINYRRLIGPAGMTTLIAGLAGPFLASLLSLIQRPGDGGLLAALPMLIFFALAGALITMPIGFTSLLIVGIPIVRATATSVFLRPIAAALVGVVAGMSIGTVTGMLLFGRDPFVWFEPISGGLFGGLWILFARRALAKFTSEQES